MTGLCFGLTSAVITTLGLMVGLTTGTGLKEVVVAGVLTISVADSLSDALGIHISEESNKKVSEKAVWESTIMTFVSKLIFGLTFLIPIFLLDLHAAVIVSILWGFALLIFLNYYISKNQNKPALGPILEHLVIAAIVIFLTYFIGVWVKSIFY